jgi:hypothetical protein
MLFKFDQVYHKDMKAKITISIDPSKTYVYNVFI